MKSAGRDDSSRGNNVKMRKMLRKHSSFWLERQSYCPIIKYKAKGTLQVLLWYQSKRNRCTTGTARKKGNHQMFHNGADTRSQCLPLNRLLHLFLLLLSCPCSCQPTSQSSAVSLQTFPSFRVGLQPRLLSKAGPVLPTNKPSLLLLRFPGFCCLLLLPQFIITNVFYLPRLIVRPLRQDPCFTSILQSQSLLPSTSLHSAAALEHLALTDVLATLVINPEAQKLLFCHLHGHSQRDFDCKISNIISLKNMFIFYCYL